MSYGCDQNPLAANEVSHLVRRSRQVDTPVAAASLPPKQWAAQDSSANTLDLSLKASAQARNTTLVKPCAFLGILFGLA